MVKRDMAEEERAAEGAASGGTSVVWDACDLVMQSFMSTVQACSYRRTFQYRHREYLAPSLARWRSTDAKWNRQLRLASQLHSSLEFRFKADLASARRYAVRWPEVFYRRRRAHGIMCRPAAAAAAASRVAAFAGSRRVCGGVSPLFHELFALSRALTLSGRCTGARRR